MINSIVYVNRTFSMFTSGNAITRNIPLTKSYYTNKANERLQQSGNTAGLIAGTIGVQNIEKGVNKVTSSVSDYIDKAGGVEKAINKASKKTGTVLGKVIKNVNGTITRINKTKESKSGNKESE